MKDQSSAALLMEAAGRKLVNSGGGAVLGIVNADWQCLRCCGESGTDRPLDGDSIFEVGSVTKLFTALLLSKLCLQGHCRLDEPVASLPGVTFHDLASHYSGLPRVPENFDADHENPYADYTVEHLRRCPSLLQAPAAAGFLYSNLGFGLLGYELGQRLGIGYEPALRHHILEPLVLADTGVTATDPGRFLDGHRNDGRPTCHWDWDCLVGGGGLRSTCKDLLRFAQAHVGLSSANGLEPAIEFVRSRRRRRDRDEAFVLLGWFTDIEGGREVHWHNGETGGFASFLGLQLESRLAVVVLVNRSITKRVTVVGLDLLERCLA